MLKYNFYEVSHYFNAHLTQQYSESIDKLNAQLLIKAMCYILID